jgi:NAD(P)-dependent dehydrogenase (short-subunit alcohol dehydrogenase family)
MSESREVPTDTSRVWFITGTSRGLGRALAEAVLDHDDRLVATARDVAAIEELERSVPDSARAIELDVTNAERAREAIAEAVDAFGRIDVVVNNAGHAVLGALEELSEEDVRRQFETNVFGVINVTRAALPQLRRQRSGHIVQMSSLDGVAPLGPGESAYAGTKFAVEGLSESLAAEVEHLGIRVTIVEPGPFRTELVGRSLVEAPAIDDYADSVGEARQALHQMNGAQPGNPARGAAAIIEAVEAEEPPLRLALGEEALGGIRAKLDERRRELDAWEPLSASTAFDAG